MKTAKAVKWEPLTGIDFPCADLSFSYTQPDEISVVMRFSNVNGLPSRDLELKFRGAISARWESESIGSLIPYTLPKCISTAWSRWTFPLLQIEDSPWIEAIAACNPSLAEGRLHFVLVTMNDLLEIAALPTAGAQWIEAQM